MAARANICVTGGAGYIGSHACYALAARGEAPMVIDNLSTGDAGAVRRGPLEPIDLRATEALAEVFLRNRIGKVLHFAASAYVGESVSDPAKYYDNNVGGMLSLLTACRLAKVKRFVLSSSCATYGIPVRLPIAENATQHPINPYGQSKLMCEHVVRDVAPQIGMPTRFCAILTSVARMRVARYARAIIPRRISCRLHFLRRRAGGQRCSFSAQISTRRTALACAIMFM
jgi:UDP-arabinose 4-epimerase